MFKGLNESQREQHRMQIGVRAEAILSQFWRDEDTSEAVRALEIEGWMDVLEYTTHAEIRAAWAEYQRNGPRGRSGALYRPDPGAIHRLIIRARQAARMKHERDTPPAEEPRMMRSEEEKAVAQALCEAAGFTPRRFGGQG